MDLRRENRRINSMQSIVIVTLLFCVMALIAIVFMIANKEAPKPPLEADGILLDANAVQGSINGDNIKSKGSDTVFYYKLNSKPYFKNSKDKGNIMLENSAGNKYLMSAEYILDQTGEVILKTGLIAENQHISEANLSTELENGIFDVTVSIMPVDKETQQVTQVFYENIKLYVGEKPAE